MNTEQRIPVALPSREARAQFSQILDRVLGGEVFVITRNGRPIAQVNRAGGNALVEIGDGDRDGPAGGYYGAKGAGAGG